MIMILGLMTATTVKMLESDVKVITNIPNFCLFRRVLLLISYL